MTPPHIVRSSGVSVLQKYSRVLSGVALKITHSQGLQPSTLSLQVFKSIIPSAESLACNIGGVFGLEVIIRTQEPENWRCLTEQGVAGWHKGPTEEPDKRCKETYRSRGEVV